MIIYLFIFQKLAQVICFVFSSLGFMLPVMFGRCFSLESLSVVFPIDYLWNTTLFKLTSFNFSNMMQVRWKINSKTLKKFKSFLLSHFFSPLFIFLTERHWLSLQFLHWVRTDYLYNFLPERHWLSLQGRPSSPDLPCRLALYLLLMNCRLALYLLLMNCRLALYIWSMNCRLALYIWLGQALSTLYFDFKSI